MCWKSDFPLPLYKFNKAFPSFSDVLSSLRSVLFCHSFADIVWIAENHGIHLSKCQPNCHNIKCHIWYDSLIYAHIASIVHRFSVFFKGLYYPRMMWNNFISYMNHGSPVYTEMLWKLFLLLFHYFRHPGFSRNKNSAPTLRSTIPVSQQTYPLLLAELLLHSFFCITKKLAAVCLTWIVNLTINTEL